MKKRVIQLTLISLVLTIFLFSLVAAGSDYHGWKYHRYKNNYDHNYNHYDNDNNHDYDKDHNYESNNHYKHKKYYKYNRSNQWRVLKYINYLSGGRVDFSDYH